MQGRQEVLRIHPYVFLPSPLTPSSSLHHWTPWNTVGCFYGDSRLTLVEDSRRNQDFGREVRSPLFLRGSMTMKDNEDENRREKISSERKSQNWSERKTNCVSNFPEAPKGGDII